MTPQEWRYTEQTLKNFAPGAYKALCLNIDRAEQRKAEAWRTLKARIPSAAQRTDRGKAAPYRAK